MIKEVMNYIAQADPEIGAAILREYDRQMHNIELIASENIVSGPAMMAMGTVQCTRRLSEKSIANVEKFLGI